MTNRHRTDKPNQHRAVAGTLAAALAVLMLSAAPAGATPTATSIFDSTRDMSAGETQYVPLSVMFTNTGTNPRLTSVGFTTTTCCYTASLIGNTVYLNAKSNAELREVFPPPSNPFTATLTVVMKNDEGQSASGTMSLKTQWDSRPPAGWPTLSQSSALAPPDVEVSAFPSYFFNNAGTNPQFSNVQFSTLDYYADSSGVESGILFVKAKSEEELNDLDSPPDSPFSVGVTLQMTNDEGRVGTGTVYYTTTYTMEEDE